MTHTTQPARGLLWQEKISRDFRRPTKYPPRPLEVIAIISPSLRPHRSGRRRTCLRRRTPSPRE